MNSIQSKRGSAIVVVIVFILALSLLIGSVLSLNLNERKRVRDKDVFIKSRYAAESLVEYGAAAFRANFHSSANVSTASLAAKLTLPDPALFSPESYVDHQSLELTARVGGRTGLTEISRTNPSNANDPMAGRRAFSRNVVLYGKASTLDPRTGRSVTSHCTETIWVRDVPLTSEAISYIPDCEIAPGDNMDIWGSVYCGRDIYLQANTGKSLSFHDSITGKAGFFHGRKPGSGQSSSDGNVLIKDKDDVATSAKDSSGNWLQSTDTNWRSNALNRWGGRVQTGAMDNTPLNPLGIPDYVPDDPNTVTNERVNSAHALIESAKTTSDSTYDEEIEVQKFAAKAGLVIEVNYGPPPSTTPVVTAYKYVPTSTGPSLYKRVVGESTLTFKREAVTIPSSAFTQKMIHDKRRGIDVQMIDLNVGVLSQLVRSPGNTADTRIGNYSISDNWNGTVYIEHRGGSGSGVRLVNGVKLPSAGHEEGFTLATNAPLYVKGNFNADGTIPADIRTGEAGEVPAALVGDAVTFLSTAWNDDTASSPISSRSAADTEVAAAIITGIVPTNSGGNGKYSGGVENLPRFLENWGGRKFAYRGSMIVLYESTVATQPWGKSDVYSPPVRLWGYSSLFKAGRTPPSIPCYRSYRRTGFRDLSAQDYAAALASP